MKLKEWWRWFDSTERKLIVFIVVALLFYVTFWILYLLGSFPYLDKPER